MLNLFAYIIIPAYTILLASHDSFLESNLSVISTDINHTNSFVVWTLLVSIYFFIILRKIIKKDIITYKKTDTTLLVISCVLMYCTATTPYLPDINPLKAELHVVFAFLSTVFIFLCFLGITIELLIRDPLTYKKHFVYLLVIMIISAILLITLGMVTSILEIFITIGLTLLAKYIVTTKVHS